MADPRTPVYTTIDGDTVRDVSTGQSIRLKGGANTPETAKEWKGQEAEVGSEAAKGAMDIAVNVLGYRPDGGSEREKYGRGLQTFTSPEGADLSAGLISAGLATPHINPKYLDGGTGLAQHAETISQIAGEGHSPLMRDQNIRLLARQASQERLSQFNQWIKTANFDNSGQAIDLKANGNFFEGRDAIVDRALARGTDGMQGMYYGFANALGEVVGSEKLAQIGADGMARNMLQALENPAAMASYEDNETFADWFTYAVEAIAEQVPQLAADLGVAVGTMGGSIGLQVAAGAGKAALRSIGGSLATSAAPRLASRGLQGVVAAGKAGAATSMYAQLVGETQGKFVEEGIDNPELALAMGVPKAAMDYIGLHTVLSQGLKPLIGKQADAATIRGVLGNSLRAASIAAPAESLTEATQILMDELAVAGQKPGYEINTKEIIEGMLKGGIAGGGIAGGANAAAGTLQMAMRQPKNTDPVTDTKAEPLASVKAQIENMPEGKVRYFTSENTEAAQEIARAAGKHTRVLESGQLQVANTAEELAALPENPTEADNAAILGYAQTKEEAAADPGGVQAVVVRDGEGVVIESQAVGASKAAEIAASYQQQYPNSQVEVTTPEAVIAEREQLIAQEKATTVQAPGGFREALKATVGKVAEKAKKALPPAKKVAPLKEKAAAPNVDASDPAAAGVNAKNLASSPVDRFAVNRALTSRLNSKPAERDETLAELLGDRKIRDLSDKEASDFAREFGIELDALPRAKGTVLNKDGESGKNVDAAYRAAAARSMGAALKGKLANNKLRADLSPIAEFLGLEPGMAKWEAYGSRDAYREAVAQAVTKKYGSVPAMVRAMAEGQYSPAEVTDMLDALGAPQPDGFKFEEVKRVAKASVKAAVAKRLPTKETRAPDTEADTELTAAQKKQIAEGEKAQVRMKKALGMFSALRENSVIGRFFMPNDAETGKNRGVLSGLFAPGKDGTALREQAIQALKKAGVDTKQGLEGLIDYADALIDTVQTNRITGGFQVNKTEGGDPEDGAPLDVEAVAVQEYADIDVPKLRKLTFLRDMLRKMQAEGVTLDTVSKKGHAAGARKYLMVISDLAQLGDIQDIDLTEPLLSDKGQQAMRESTVLAASLYALNDPAISVATLRNDILAATGLTDADLAALSVVTPDGSAITAEAALDAVATAANRYGAAAERILRAQVESDGDSTSADRFFGDLVENLKSKSPATRQMALRTLERRMRWVDAGKLEATREAMLSRGGELRPASAGGISDRPGQTKSEQQMSDWTFFGAMRRARAFFRAPAAMRRKDAWRRKEGEPSVFDTHNTWVVDFENFFDTAQGYSLGTMNQADYINDPRFLVHGLAVTAPGQETRYLKTPAEIQAFVGELKASEKPVALVGHNAAFDGQVMAQHFGFEPDIWIDTLELSRLATPEERFHSLGVVADRMGMRKPIEDLGATDGKRDLATELTAEEQAAFDAYAKGDADITLAFLQQNEPSLAFAAEASDALRVVRGVASAHSLSVEHFDFGDTAMPGIARSVETTRLLEGRNLLMIPHRETRGGGLKTLPFDAVALASFSQSGNKKAESAVDAARNLLDALSRMAVGPESDDIGVGLKIDSFESVPLHDDLVIFLDPKEGPVTFGEAMGKEAALHTRDGKLQAAERSQDSLRDRLGELDARLQELAATLYGMEKSEPSDLRKAALGVWIERALGGKLTDDDILAGAVEGWSKGGEELLKEVRKIGNSVNAPAKKGMKTSLADNHSERLTVLGELARAGKVAKVAKEDGAEANPLDDEQSARYALAKAANEVLEKTGGVGKQIEALMQQASDLASALKLIRSKKGKARAEAIRAERAAKGKSLEGLNGPDDIKAKLDEVERSLEFAMAAKAWGEGEGRVYPSDIPQHQVDSMLRGGGFSHVAESYGVAVRSYGVDSIRTGESVKVEAVDTKVLDEDSTMMENREGLRAEQRMDGVERREEDGLARLYDGVNTSRVADLLAARKDQNAGPRMDARVFDASPRPAAQPKQPAAPGTKAESDPDARAPGKKAPVLGFENKLGREFAFLTPFINRLRELNVPMDNVTLLSHSSAAALWRANQGTELGQLLSVLVNGDGSAYFSHNGRSYVLIDRDPSEKQAAVEDLAHELGHVTKDRVWADLLESDRAAVEAEFAAAHPDAKADDLLLHEWFADQFMRAVVAQVAKAEGPNQEEQSKSPVAKAIAALLDVVRKVWEAVSKTGEASKGFQQFANNLFAGQYRGKGVSARATTQIYYASGADMLSQVEANRLQMGVNKVKQGWKKGVVPSLRAVMGTVIGQIEAIDSQLAGMLFQRANADSNGGRAYEQTHMALAQRMLAEKDRLIAGLSSAKGKKRTAEIQAALTDAFTGNPVTEAGKKARAGLDRLAELAKKEGLKSIQIEDGFPIAVFDREAVERSRSAFLAKLTAKMEISPTRASEIYMGIVEGTGSLEGAIAPGLPVGMHVSTREILAKIPYAELRDAGWLLQEHEAALQHWVGGVAKRTAWEKTFGGYSMGNAKALAMQVFGKPDPEGILLTEAGLMDDAGRLYNPNAKFHEALNRVRATGGDQAAQRVLDLLDGVMGRTGANMPQGLRKAQDFVLAFVNMLTLGFSGLHSIPELGTSLVRAGGRVGIGDMMGSIDEGRRLAESLGFVLSDASQRIVWQATGEQYQSPLAQKMNYWLFKINMNQRVTNMARTLATGVGVQYLLKSVADGDNAALGRLNIDAATVRAWESLGKNAPSLGQSEAEYAINSRVADALAQFVSEATVAPSRFQATHWGNNPMFKLVWHLKHFMWAYGDIVLGGMWRDAQRRFKHLDGPAFNRALAAAAPAMIFALVMMPLAAGALEMRDWVREINDTRVERRTGAEYIGAMFDRAGGLGPLAFVAGAYQAQADYGVSIFGSLAPTLGKVDMLFTDYKDDGEIDKAELLWKVRQMTPIWSQNKTMFGLLE